MKKNIMHSFPIYILYLFLLVIAYAIGNFEQHKIYFVLGFVVILIKDLLIYGYEGTPIKNHYHDKSKLFSEEKTFLYKSLFINRHYLFPILLVGYMVVILINQTHLFQMNDSYLFKNINNTFVLGLTILSGILTIFQEEKNDIHKEKSMSITGIVPNIIITILLSILGTYIIILQTQALGLLFYPISIVSGILIFIVGISILDDSEKKI